MPWAPTGRSRSTAARSTGCGRSHHALGADRHPHASWHCGAGSCISGIILPRRPDAGPWPDRPNPRSYQGAILDPRPVRMRSPSTSSVILRHPATAHPGGSRAEGSRGLPPLPECGQGRGLPAPIEMCRDRRPEILRGGMSSGWAVAGRLSMTDLVSLRISGGPRLTLLRMTGMLACLR